MEQKRNKANTKEQIKTKRNKNIGTKEQKRDKASLKEKIESKRK
jgi:hypothetical protein